MALQDIPDELLAEIFIRLPKPGDVIHASRVCVSFRRVVADRSFLRRCRKLHAPPVLGFLTQQPSEKHLHFQPAIVPYHSTEVGNVTPRAADFSFSFLPAGDWVVCDIRDGRVLLDSARGNSPDGSFFTETVVCDPLHRRYLLLPPIPKDLVALMEKATVIKEIRVYETFLFPPSGDDDEEDTSFRVIWIAMCRTKLVAFVFSSSSGQWQAGPSRRWTDIFRDALVLWPGSGLNRFSRRQYANGCFFWLLEWKEKILVLDIRMMEFSSVDAPPGTKGLSKGDITIVEEGEDVCAMFVRASRTSYLKYTVKRNSGGSYQWHMKNRMSLDFQYFFTDSVGRYILLYKYGSPILLEAGGFSLDSTTFQLKRVCASMLDISHTYIYSNFPPSLLSTPTISSGKLSLHPCYHFSAIAIKYQQLV